MGDGVGAVVVGVRVGCDGAGITRAAGPHTGHPLVTPGERRTYGRCGRDQGPSQQLVTCRTFELTAVAESLAEEAPDAIRATPDEHTCAARVGQPGLRRPSRRRTAGDPVKESGMRLFGPQM
jgi:hypothetical protein